MTDDTEDIVYSLLRLGLAPAAVAFVSTAQAASFDRAKARARVERLVCGNRGFGARDEIASSLHAAALRQGGGEAFRRVSVVAGLR